MPYTFDYDASYDPALPVVEIAVWAFDQTGESVTLTALVDSGADGTMLPLRALKRLKARKTAQVYVRGVSGVRYLADIYEVTLRIGAFDLPKVRAVADPRNQETILGRDVLNQLIVTLNGLAQVTEITR